VIPVFGEEMEQMNKPISVVVSSRAGGSLIRTRRVSREVIGLSVRLPAGLFAGLLSAVAFMVLTPTALAAPSRVYESSFGSFTEPQALAVDQASGDVYVVDVGAGTVSRFTAAGGPAEFSATKSNVLSGFVFEAGAAQVAVAPAGSPGGTAGDVYVVSDLTDNVSVYDSSGTHVGELNGSKDGSGGFGEVCGVATEASTGAVYVGDFNGHVWRYTPSSGTVSEADYSGGIETAGAVCGVAADGGSVYAGNTYSSGAMRKYKASDFATGSPLAASSTLLDSTSTAVAVDPGDGDVYVDEGSKVSVFDSSGSALYSFGSSSDFGSNSAGVAVKAGNGKAYVADQHAGGLQVDVYGPAVNPASATTEPASVIHHTDALLNGHLGLGEDTGITACRFDWGTTTAYTGGTVPCAQGNSFSAPADVSALLNDLTPGTPIHYRLDITGVSSGEVFGADRVFTPSPFPVVHTQVASFGQDGTSGTTFPTNDRLAFRQAGEKLYVLAKGSPGIFGFDASSLPGYTVLAGFAPLSTAATGNDPALAVDNTALSSAGNIYYVSENAGKVYGFDGSGAALGGNFPIDPETNPGTPSGSPEDICGAAVDSSGDLWIANYETKSVLEYSSAGVFQKAISTAVQGGSCQLAFDSADDLYVAAYNGPTREYTAASGYATSTEVDPAETKAVAVDTASGEVYVAHEKVVYEYSSAGALAGELATGISGASFRGITVDTINHDVYVSDAGNNKVLVFAPGAAIEGPTVTPESASAVAGVKAVLHAKVDPETIPVSDCHFEYGTTTAYGHTAPCSPAPGSGSGDVAVSATISGLQPSTVYHYRITATNSKDESTGADQTLTTTATAVTQAASSVTVGEATLNGTFNPEGSPTTTCEFEYGTTVAYGQTAVCASDPGSGGSPAAVSAALTGLQLVTTYHYRLRAASNGSEGFGADSTFTTGTPRDFVGGVGLPDGRVYELVSNPDSGDEEVYLPRAVLSSSSVRSEFPLQASVGGGAVAFVGSPPVSGVGGVEGTNQYVARRSGNGWSQVDVLPAGHSSVRYEGFSDDLSVGFFDSLEPLVSGAPGFGEPFPVGGNYDDLYTRSMTGGGGEGGYVPLVTATPPYRSRTGFASARVGHYGLGGTGKRGYDQRVLAYAGASADSSHVLFEANDALTPGADGGSATHYAEENNLYEYANGQLRLVNVLPDGSTHVNASFGAPNFESVNGFIASPDFSRVISSDGSRVFWTDLNTGHIYVRENGTSTVEISSAGKYWTASADGSKVFYTNGDLYEYDLDNAHTTDLTPGVTVQGVIGASENGDYVYYVTTGLDLNVWHNGATSTVKTLTANDNGNGLTGLAKYQFAGDWQPGYGNRMAEVSPDGRGLVFMSTNGGAIEEPSGIDVYDAVTGRLYCASCGSGGSRGFLPLTFSNTYLKRWISADGSRVFFDSFEALVSRDTNGKLDVYEWERPGSGDCKTSATGCVYLLSGGTSSDDSFFADASASGDDVFIVTRAKLLSRDDNEMYDLYDVRADGSEPVTTPACTGTGCQGLPAAPPIFATPSSATYEGLGNFAAPVPALTPKSKAKKKPKPKPKRKAKHKKKAPKKDSRAHKGHTGNTGGSGHGRSGGKGGRS
jgi:hypothetical protein